MRHFPRRAATRTLARRDRDAIKPLELGAQQVGVPGTPFIDGVELLQLRSADGGTELRHPKIKADNICKIVFAGIVAEHDLTVIENKTSARRDLGVTRDDHAALAGHDVLRLLEAEYPGIADRTGAAVAP